MQTQIKGFLTKAYPTAEQDQAMYEMQPSLRCAWNWMTDLWDSHVRRCEQWAVNKGIVAPLGPKPDYTGMNPEQAKSAKQSRQEVLYERRKVYMLAAKSDIEAPQYLPLTAAKEKPSVQSRCLSIQLVKGKAQDYQILNFVLRERGLAELPSAYLQSLVKSHRSKGITTKSKQKRKDCDVMPIKIRTGGDFRLENVGPHNASVKLPGVPGRLAVRVDPKTVSQLSCPGTRVVEGVTLRYEYGTFWCSLLIEKPVTGIYAGRKASKRAKAQVVLVDSGKGPQDGAVLGIDPGLANLVADSAGTTIRNKRNIPYLQARSTALGVLALATDAGQDVSVMVSEVYRQDARMRRRTLENFRQYAADVDRKYEFVNVECNSGIALGIGQKSYVGSTKLLLQVLRQRLGVDRVREVESYYNSQDCSQCGHRDKITWERKLGQLDQTCRCTVCGYTADRDHNAARNVAAKSPKLQDWQQT